MAELFANNAQSTLVLSVTDSSTSIQVVSNAPFPSGPQFRIRVDNEIMIVTAVAGAVFTVTRGSEGTVAAAHSSGASVTHVLTAGAIAQMASEIIAIPGPQGPTGPQGPAGPAGTDGAVIRVESIHGTTHTSNYTITLSDLTSYDSILLDPSGAPFSITLPTGAPVGSRIKLVDITSASGSNPVTVNAPVGEDLLGSASTTVNTNGRVMWLWKFTSTRWVFH